MTIEQALMIIAGLLAIIGYFLKTGQMKNEARFLKIEKDMIDKPQCQSYRALQDERIDGIRAHMKGFANQQTEEHREINRTMSNVDKSLQGLEKCVVLLGVGKEC